MMSPANDRGAFRFAVLFVSITLLAIWVRLPVLHQGLWEDEATSVFIARAPTIGEFLHRQAAIDYSPPLFNALLAGYGRVFGFGEVPVKTLAIGIGSLACGAIALAAAECFGLAGGIFAGIFAIVHPLLIEMAAEVRPYSFSALATALCFWALFRYQRGWIEGQPRASDLALFGITALLAAESHYSGTVAVIVIGAFAACASLLSATRKTWFPVLLTTSAVGAFLLPWAPIAWRQLHVGLPWAIRSKTVTIWGMALFKTSVLLPAAVNPRSASLPLALALCVTSLIAAWPLARQRIREHGSAIVLPILAATAALFAVGVAGPGTRYVTVPAALATIVLGGMMAIVLDVAVDSSGRLERACAASGVVLLALWAVRPAVERRSGMVADARSGRSRSLVRDLCREGLFRADDLVIAAPDMLGPTLRYYLPPGVMLRGLVHWDDPAFADFSDYWVRWKDPRLIDETVAALDTDLGSHRVRRILLVYAVGNDNPLPFRTRTRELRSALTERFPLASSHVYRGPADVIQIDVFAP
jgi:hypothetical protein